MDELGYRVVDAPSHKRERGGDKAVGTRTTPIDALKAARSQLPKRVDRLADVDNGNGIRRDGWPVLVRVAG